MEKYARPKPGETPVCGYKQQDRNRKRRTGGGGRSRRVDWHKEEQAASANRAGRSAADKVNLEPFLKEGNKPKGELGD